MEKWARSEYDECGGYDCMYPGIDIRCGGDIIATVDGKGYGVNSCEIATAAEIARMEASANLLAAAPDLLAALSDLCFFCQEMDPSNTMREVWEKAESAIAKSKGE